MNSNEPKAVRLRLPLRAMPEWNPVPACAAWWERYRQGGCRFQGRLWSPTTRYYVGIHDMATRSPRWLVGEENASSFGRRQTVRCSALLCTVNSMRRIVLRASSGLTISSPPTIA